MSNAPSLVPARRQAGVLVRTGSIVLIAVLVAFGGFFNVLEAQAVANITVTSPASGVHWGGIQNVIWTDNSTAAPYRLYYSSDFSVYTNFVSNVNTASYSWNTASITDGVYKLKVKNNLDEEGISETFTVDNTPPSLTAPANVGPTEATGLFTVVALGSPIVSDILDPAPGVTNDAPASFPVGITVITYTATDWAGNVSTATQTVTITDSTPPTITSHLDEAAFSATSAGVAVSYALPTATDLVDGSVPVTCLPVSGSVFPAGTTAVLCDAIDSHSNPAIQTTFNVVVTDNIAPTILGYTLNGSAQSVTFNPGTVTINIAASEPVKFNRIRICETSDATCNDTTETKHFTQTATFNLVASKTWDGIASSSLPALDGEYRLKVNIVDEGGNSTNDIELAPHTVTIDTLNPTVSVVAPVADVVYKTNPPLQFTPDGTGTATTCSYVIDSGAPNPVLCTSGVLVDTTIPGLSDGRHSVVVTVVDAAGNIVPSTPVSFVRDTDNTLTVDDDGIAFADFATIQAAINAATAGDTISVAEGTYTTTGQVLIDKNLVIVGSGLVKPVINPAADLPATNGVAGAWFLVNASKTFNLSNVALNGNGMKVYQGVRSHGLTTINNVDFSNIRDTANPYVGFAVAGFGGTVAGGAGSDTHGGGGAASTLTITGSTFSQIGRIGVLVKGTSSTAIISGNTYTGKGAGDFLDYAFEVGAGGSAAIGPNNAISNNLGVALSDGSTSAGILVTTYYGAGTNATIAGNEITNSTEGIVVGYDGSDTSTVVIHSNKITGNTTNGVSSTAPTVNAIENWWGSATGPTHATNPGGSGDAVSSNVDYSPWCLEPTCTPPFGSNDPLDHIAMTLSSPVTLPETSTVTITAQDIDNVTRVNETAQVLLTADGGATFGSTLLSFVNGVATTTVTNASAATINVTATIVGGTQAATGQVVFNGVPVVVPTGTVATWESKNNFAEATDLYLDGWHYLFKVTVYDESETEMFVRFTDWVNIADATASVSINGNVRLLINQAGGIVAGVGSEAVIESGSGDIKSYGLGNAFEDQTLGVTPNTPIDISGIDDNDSSDPTVGRQVQFDVFTKIPLGTPAGFYSTDYEISTQIP